MLLYDRNTIEIFAKLMCLVKWYYRFYKKTVKYANNVYTVQSKCDII